MQLCNDVFNRSPEVPFLSSSVMLTILSRLFLSALCKDILIPEDTYFVNNLTKRTKRFSWKAIFSALWPGFWNSLIVILSQIINWRYVARTWRWGILKMCTLPLAGTYSNGQLWYWVKPGGSSMPRLQHTTALLSIMRSTHSTTMMRYSSLHYMYCTSLFY